MLANERGKKESGSLNLRSLKRIVSIMNRAKITELDIEQDGIKIHLKKGPTSEEMVSSLSAAAKPLMAMSMPAPVAAAPVPQAAAPASEPVLDANLHTITSPMVGTFYRASNPDAKPYVEVGSQVDVNTVVCIVEAMKLMNEIKAETKGVIKKILAENAQAIEFGQPLFLVDTKG